MRERVELGLQGEEMRDAGAVLQSLYLKSNFKKMNDVLSFF